MDEKRRIWIADDSRLERNRSSDILGRDYLVETFVDGIDVVEAFARERPPDVLVIDWTMVAMHAGDVIEFARAHPGTDEMGIIVVTGDTGATSVSSALQAGADDFIRKPAEETELLARVARLVRRQEQREELRVEHTRARQEAQARLSEERSRGDLAAEQAHLADLFVGILSHDLRIPLGAISLGASLLEKDLEPERRRTVAARIQGSVARMNEMIGQLLDLTRARVGGGIEIATERYDVARLCEEVADEVRAARPGREIFVATSGDTFLELDPGRLAQVMSNLLGNALQHGDASSAVRVAVRGEPARVIVEVQNQGPAIAADLLDKLFDPFQRASRSPTAPTGSIGLGLYISKQIARSHGGELDVRSDSEWTTFTLAIPRRLASPPSE